MATTDPRCRRWLWTWDKDDRKNESWTKGGAALTADGFEKHPRSSVVLIMLQL